MFASPGSRIVRNLRRPWARPGALEEHDVPRRQRDRPCRGTTGDAAAAGAAAAGTGRLRLPLELVGGRPVAVLQHRPGALGTLRRQSAAPADRDVANPSGAGGRRPGDDRPGRSPGAGNALRPAAPLRHGGGQRRASGGLLLRRVRRARLAADLFRRPGRAGGGHPQGGVGPGAADGRRRPALPHRLLPPAHRRHWHAARVLARRRSAAAALRAGARRRLGSR